MTNFGSVFHHFMPFCFFFRHFGCCYRPLYCCCCSFYFLCIGENCSNEIVEPGHSVMSTILPISYSIVKKKQYKTLFFHKYYREFCIHVSKHGEDKIDRFNHNICINSMLYEAEQRRYLLYRKKYCVMRS